MEKGLQNTRRMIVAALCLALCIVLPFLTGQIPQIGSALCPMHLPVLLAGFICGPVYAAVIGLVAPLLRFVMFGMPPLFPTGIAMSMELMTYGLVSALLHKALPKKITYIYGSLLIAMVSGRIVWGAVRVLLSGISGNPFTWQAFMAGAVLNSVPGIILQLVLIPVLVVALERNFSWMREGK